MRSSRGTRSGLALVAIAAGLAMACSSEPASPQADGAAATLDCSMTGVAADAIATVQELRRAAETGPAYEALASKSAPHSCRAISDSGQTSIEYRFANGGTLTFARNPAIEYSNQEASFGSGAAGDVVALLRRVERASFAPDGCGINWNEAMPLASTDGVAETGYYGETCNCQARVRADAAGTVVGFVFRSSC